MNISGNIDNPEGTLDALMQIAVCGSVRLLYIVDLYKDQSQLCHNLIRKCTEYCLLVSKFDIIGNY